MARRVRKRTKAELASQAFRDETQRRAAVLMESYRVSDKLSKSRRQFILNIAGGHWVQRFPEADDESAFNRESRKWDRLRNAFLREATNPLELHWFSCNWNCDAGVTPLLRIVKNDYCDAGTALRLYWLNGPYYFQEYRTIGACPCDEEREMLRIMRTIEGRFKRGDFATKRIPFDPAPWMRDDLAEEAVHQMPAVMREPIVARTRKRK